MAMAPATRAPGGPAPARFLSRSSFLVPCPSAAAVRLSRRGTLGVAPRSGRRDGWGSQVDEDMATLRRRIREARAELSEDDDAGAGAGLHAPLPAEWTELERRHHGSYMAGVRGAAGLLEALLVGARPGLGAGVLALLLLGVPASAFLVCARLIQLADAVASGLR